MMPGLSDFITALGIALVIEGIAYTLFPGRARNVFELVSQMPESTMRYLGLGAAIGGVIVVWMVRG
jgi:uncharacterized protein